MGSYHQSTRMQYRGKNSTITIFPYSKLLMMCGRDHYTYADKKDIFKKLWPVIKCHKNLDMWIQNAENNMKWWKLVPLSNNFSADWTIFCKFSGFAKLRKILSQYLPRKFNGTLENVSSTFWVLPQLSTNVLTEDIAKNATIIPYGKIIRVPMPYWQVLK